MILPSPFGSNCKRRKFANLVVGQSRHQRRGHGNVTGTTLDLLRHVDDALSRLLHYCKIDLSSGIAFKRAFEASWEILVNPSGSNLQIRSPDTQMEIPIREPVINKATSCHGSESTYLCYVISPHILFLAYDNKLHHRRLSA